MKRSLPLLLGAAAVLASCAGTLHSAGPGARPAIVGSNNLPQSYYDDARRRGPAAAVTEVSPDASYGFSPKNPVCVGGGGEGGARNQQQYLNALRGPHGEPISYRRVGSCCPFKTRHALIGNMGLLDAYELTWPGNDKPLALYLNLYDQGPLRIPHGADRRPAVITPSRPASLLLLMKPQRHPNFSEGFPERPTTYPKNSGTWSERPTMHPKNSGAG